MTLIELTPGETYFETLQDVEIVAPPSIQRSSSSAGSTPPGMNYTVNLKDVSHALIHDVHGVGWWSAAPSGNTIGGSIFDLTVFNVGWAAPDRGHGHGLYTQNTGEFPKSVDSSVFIAGFGIAGKVYGERPVTEPCKLENYTIRNSIFVGSGYGDPGDFIIGGRYQGAEDVVIENCVFVGTVNLGYIGRNKRVTFRNNLILGNLVLAAQDDMVVEENIIIVRPPHRAAGYTYGPGNFGWSAQKTVNYGNPVVSGNVIYTDVPNVAFCGWSWGYASANGYGVWDTALLPLSARPQIVREYPLSETERNVFVYNSRQSETIPLTSGASRIRDIRRWDSPYIGENLVMSGEPTQPVNWTQPTPPKVTPDGFPVYGVFRIETLSLQEKLDMANAQIESLRLALDSAQAAVDALGTAIDTKDAEIEAAGITIDALNAQVAVLISERDEAIARASTFQGVLGGVVALVQPHLPAA